MKKFLVLLLVLGIALTGCAKDNAPETVDPDREPKAEQPEDVEDVEEVVVDEEKAEMMTFTGLVSSNAAPYMVILEEEYNPIKVNDKEYTKIVIDGDKIEKYMSRYYFAYHIEGFPMIDTYGQYVTMSIEFDPANAVDDERGQLYVSEYNLIPNPGEELVDESSKDYPLTYYQDVIMTLCLGMYGNDADDIKDNPGYENTDFKEAVNKALDKGYTFVKENGYYKIVNEDAYNFDHMPTVDEMCETLEIDKSEIQRKEDGGYFIYSSSYSNDDIAFVAYHDEEELKGSQKVDILLIRSYKYNAFGVSLSDNLNQTYKELGSKYQGMYSHHTDSRAKYVYDIDGYGLTLNSISYMDDYEVRDYDFVKWMRVFAVID